MKKILILLFCIPCILISCSEKIINSDTPVDDFDAPSAVTDLSVVFTTGNSAALELTTTGDDSLYGRARIYDVRYSTSIIDSANFSLASLFTPIDEPKVGGVKDTIVVPGLLANTKYYFAVKLGDEVPNWSPISNIDSATTLLGGNWVIYNIDNSEILSNTIVDLQFDGTTKYIATSGGVSTFLNADWTTIYDINTVLIDTIIGVNDTTIDTSNYSSPNSIAIESSSKIWLGTNSNGVALIEGATTSFYTSNDSGLLTSTVDVVVSQNKLWVGTFSNGLHSFMLDGSDVWEQYDVPIDIDHPFNGNINCVESDANNAIWSGLQVFGTTVLENGIFTHYDIDENFTNGQVLDITSSATKVIFGTDYGVFIFENNTWTNYTTTNGLPHNSVTAVAIDAQGIIWCGTPSGLASFNGSAWSVYTTANSGLPENYINTVNVDILGNIWIGTNNGLARLSN